MRHVGGRSHIGHRSQARLIREQPSPGTLGNRGSHAAAHCLLQPEGRGKYQRNGPRDIGEIQYQYPDSQHQIANYHGRNHYL